MGSIPEFPEFLSCTSPDHRIETKMDHCFFVSRYTGKPKVIVGPSSTVNVTAGSSVTLQCTATGYPPPAVQWIVEQPSRSNLQVIEDGRGELKLVAKNVTTKDQGNYTCHAQNLVGITTESVQLLGKLFVHVCY